MTARDGVGFTPGPWRVEECGDPGCWCRVIVSEAEDAEECHTVINGGALRSHNAALVAAAPDLYEALDQLLIEVRIAQSNMRRAAKYDPKWEGCAEAIQSRVDSAAAALRRARGEA